MAANQLADPEAMATLRSHPLMKEFRAVLALRQSHLMEAWSKGQPMGEAEQAQAVTLGRILSLSSEDVAELYGIEVNHGDATEARTLA